MVPEAGFEPARVLPHRILNPTCLPISPLRPLCGRLDKLESIGLRCARKAHEYNKGRADAASAGRDSKRRDMGVSKYRGNTLSSPPRFRYTAAPRARGGPEYPPADPPPGAPE